MLDEPQDATGIFLGVLLSGSGTVSISHVVVTALLGAHRDDTKHEVTFSAHTVINMASNGVAWLSFSPKVHLPLYPDDIWVDIGELSCSGASETDGQYGTQSKTETINTCDTMTRISPPTIFG